MKPNFALNLTHEGITLLHRAKAGWMRIGDVALDAPDLEDQLKVLRQTASDLESGGLTSKLVIPESQILYTTLELRGRDTAGQITQIREGLIGLTPYDVKDLIFDWRMNGKRAQVAVVARDTLQEAEAFAAEFRFNPVSFVAMPEDGNFEGEPFFGPTKHADTLLGPDERVEPDKKAMVVMSPPRPKPKLRVGGIIPTRKPDETEDAGQDAGQDKIEALEADAVQAEAVPAIAPDAASPKDADPETVGKADPALAAREPVEEAATAKDAEKSKTGTESKTGTVSKQPDSPEAAPDESAEPEPAPEPTPDPEPEVVPVAFSSRRRGAASVPEPAPQPRAELPPLDTAPEPDLDTEAKPEAAALAPLDPILAPPRKSPSITVAPTPVPTPLAAQAKPNLGGKGKATSTAPEKSPPVSPPVSPAARAAAIGTISDFDPLDDIPDMPPSFGAVAHRGPAGRSITQMPMTSDRLAGGSAARASAVEAPGFDPTFGVGTSAYTGISTKARALTGSLAGVGENTAELTKVARDKALAAGGAVAGTVASTIDLLGRGTAAGVKRMRKRPDAVAASNTEAEALTVFGARNQAAIGGKPRFLGLMLTLCLLLALAVLALWSTFFLSDSNPGVFDNGDETPQIAAIDPATPLDSPSGAELAPDTLQPDAAAIDGPASDEIGAAVDSVLAGLVGTDTGTENGTDAGSVTGTEIPQDRALELDPASPETPTEAPLDLTTLQQPDPSANPAPDQVLAPPPTRVEAEVSYAATGIWQLDPEPPEVLPSGDRLEDVFVASLDPGILTDDLSDLPATEPLLNDQRPEALRPPAPLGTRFDFDERGLVRATEDGALTPDGALVFAGTPAFIPPARPGTEPPLPEPEPPVVEAPAPETSAPEAPVAEAPAQEAPTAEAPETETVQEQILTPEQLRLLEIRPVPRPGTLDETTNRAVPLEDVIDSELAALRPVLRPASLEVALPEEPAAPEVAARPDPEPEVEAEPNPETAADSGSELAVLDSRTPTLRPRGLAARVTEARQQEDPAARVNVPAPNVAAAVVPNVPARASVAKAATERNAINLSRVNLIGVYGSPSDRRALVRLKNGRYVKVEVGDRVDGGRVSAISDKELLYVKSGRNITLQMPQG